jgi:hypothetical protein
MKKVLLVLMLGITSLVPISSVSNAADCPTSWPLQFKSDFLKSLPIETTGLLESYRNSLGRNIAIEFTKEYSQDKTGWVPYTWPMKWPDGEVWVNGPGVATNYLYPGFTRDTIKIEVKGCPSSASFYSNEILVTPIVSKNHTFDDLVIPGNFKQQESGLSDILKIFENSLDAYSKSGKISDRYPTDDSIIFITPKLPGCLGYTGGLPAFWVSKGKKCDIYVYSNQLKNRRANLFDLEGNPVEKFVADTNYRFGLFVVKEITLNPPTISKQIFTCIKGKISKKVSATKPKCPTGYKIKA